ncbi:hypothetical protein CP532_3176 [Ophiocordyceps camponoti-leonardi (nom. inval.)]|nr:hypothetical protein CP532_3176 [Ophiocordyceps camponoti-leonardi (nom. inval.)]
MSLFQILLVLLIPLVSAFPPPPHSSPPRAVFILSSTESRWATKAVGDALKTLGFTHAVTATNDPDALVENSGGRKNTYSQLSRDDTAAWQRLASSMPDARFILPADTVAEEIDDDIRRFFSANDNPDRLLELFVGRRVPADQAENWVTLCRFLGLGYSVVERLKLWYFPR